MADAVIRPSLKFVKAGYALVVALIAGAVIAHYAILAGTAPVPWLPIATALLLLWPIERHIRRQAVKVTIAGDKLRYESGFLSTSTRIIHLSKIQDVRVNQSLAQRLFGVGDVSIETAGESSRLVVRNLDAPHAIAEEIMEAPGRGMNAGAGL